MWARSEGPSGYLEINKLQYGALLAVNICYMVFGIVLMCKADILKANATGFEFFVIENYYIFSTMMNIIGMFNIIMGIIGILTILRKNFAVIFSYWFSFIHMLIALVLLATVILGEEINSSVHKEMESMMEASLKDYSYDHTNVVFAWDNLQRTLSCCGGVSPFDWMDAIGLVPISCCAIPEGQIGSIVCDFEKNNQYIYRVGCMEPLSELIVADLTNVAGIGLGFLVVQILFLLFTFTTGWSFRETNRQSNRFHTYNQNVFLANDQQQRSKQPIDEKNSSVYF